MIENQGRYSEECRRASLAAIKAPEFWIPAIVLLVFSFLIGV